MAEITLRTDLSELIALHAFVERFATEQALPTRDAFQLGLVLEELVTNAWSHGGLAETGGTIRVGLIRQGNLVEIELVDEGLAFDPREFSEPDVEAPLEDRPIGGLGVLLVRRFVDEIDYRREDGRNHLRLRKRVAAPTAPDEDEMK